MSGVTPTRRRFIGISAAAAGLAILPFGARASGLATWTGQALGAVCTLQVHHPDDAAANRLIGRVVGEVRRLEGMFSLYDEGSVLSRLNRTGFVAAPPPEFVDLLTQAQEFSRLTGGLFDVTVQPLWKLYADHFSRKGFDPDGPSAELVHAALELVGADKLAVGRDRVSLRRGSALTLNGIAQGFITDKAVELLRSEGVSSSLVDMGETRALGSHPDGRPWQAAIDDPLMPGRAATTVPVVDRALATSGPYGFRFDQSGRFNHLFSPATGACAGNWASVSVLARTATAADAFSTAGCLMSEAELRTMAVAAQADLILLVRTDGTQSRISA